MISKKEQSTITFVFILFLVFLCRSTLWKAQEQKLGSELESRISLHCVLPCSKDYYVEILRTGHNKWRVIWKMQVPDSLEGRISSWLGMKEIPPCGSISNTYISEVLKELQATEKHFTNTLGGPWTVPGISGCYHRWTLPLPSGSPAGWVKRGCRWEVKREDRQVNECKLHPGRGVSLGRLPGRGVPKPAERRWYSSLGSLSYIQPHTHACVHTCTGGEFR